MDYDQLYKQLAQEIVNAEGRLEGGAAAFIQRFLAKLQAEGYQLQGDAEQALTAYLNGINDEIKSAIAKALEIGMGSASLQSPQLLAATEHAFKKKWPDGLTLSKRLWQLSNKTRKNITEVLQAGVKQGEATGKVIYDMQRVIERGSGERFTVVSQHKAQWVDRLALAGRELINDPQSRKNWQKVVADTEAYIDSLAVTGTRRDAERLLHDIKSAVAKGRSQAIDDAVKWKIYNKQLYNLKRITRTEMADAGHNAVIDANQQDETIIGYQWRLSSSHKVADICDYFASIDMGLGKGVFTKDSVPRHKAHPHCMCLLIPRVTPIRQPGHHNYATFVENAKPELRKQLLPKWAQNALENNIPVKALLRPDGMGLITQEQARKPIFKAWARRVAEQDYHLRHEFMQAGVLPDSVLSHARIKALKPVNAKIYISDHQLRHALRSTKASRGVALSAAALEQLPDKFDGARWFYDSSHDNLVAIFEVANSTIKEKAVVRINFEKQGKARNAIVTTGIISASNLQMRNLEEIIG